MPLGHGWLEMGFDYTGLRDDTVEPLIAEYGKMGVLHVNVPATGAEPYESQLDGETLHDVVVVQTQFKKTDNMGTLVEMGDVGFLVSTEGLVIDPDLAQRISANGLTYQIIRIDPLQPGPVVMFWKVHARK